MRGETKEERFKRIAEKRVQLVIEDLRKLSQCANRRMYQWDDEQLGKIWNAIGKGLDTCRASFEDAEHQEFRL